MPEEKKGSFRTSTHKPVVKEIKDAEKFEKKGKTWIRFWTKCANRLSFMANTELTSAAFTWS